MKILVFNKDLPPIGALENDEKTLGLNRAEGEEITGSDLVIWSWEKQDFLNQIKTFEFDLIIHGGDLILPTDAQKLFNPSQN
jgi:hypothetical protein